MTIKTISLLVLLTFTNISLPHAQEDDRPDWLIGMAFDLCTVYIQGSETRNKIDKIIKGSLRIHKSLPNPTPHQIAEFWSQHVEDFVCKLVREAHRLSNGSAGARTIADIVTNDDSHAVSLSRYRAEKLMKKLGLVSCQLLQHTYKKAIKEHVAIPNLLDRQFSVTAPNQVWCGDVSFIWTGHRWAYLAVVIDLFTRKPVGWAMSHSPDSNLTCQALTMA